MLSLAAASDSRWVRVEAAHQRAAHPEIVERLAADPDELVRSAVTSNQRCPTEVLDRLAADCEPVVRVGAAVHTSTSRAALLALAGDEDRGVRDRAVDTLTGRWGLTWDRPVLRQPL